DGIHGQDRGLARCQTLDEFLVLARPEKGDEPGTLAQEVCFVDLGVGYHGGSADLEHEVTRGPEFLGGWEDPGARFGKGAIENPRTVPCARLDGHVETHAPEPLHGRGRRRHPALSRLDLPGNTHGE